MFSILIYLLNNKRYSLGIPLLAGLLGILIAWLLPPYYKSDIRLRVDESSESSLSSLVSATTSKSMGGFASFLTNKSQLSPEDLYMEILDGRDLKIAVIKQFHLDTLYKKKSTELLLKALSRDLIVELDNKGIISCSFEAKDKILARNILKFAVVQANNRYMELQRERIKYSLEYLQDNRTKIADSIASTGNELVKFYRSNNLLDLKIQMELTIQSLAGYEEQINNFKLSEQNQISGSSEQEELRKKRQILETEFTKLRGNFTQDYKPSTRSVYLNSDWAVSKLLYQEQMESKLKRQLTILEAVSAEQSLTEAQYVKNQPVIQIIQDAYLPDWKSKPKRASWAIAAASLSFVFVMILLILKGIWVGELVEFHAQRLLLKKLAESLTL